MPKNRVPVPKQVREQVLSEFNHRCAICGTDRPQIHHIDEDPANNESWNLLPLCPNCHLIDQHNPTAQIDPRKLGLFRRYKDPVILCPQFHPLFRRLSYLLDLDADADFDYLTAAATELIAFINALKMGGFYHVRIADLITLASPGLFVFGEADPLLEQRVEESRREYIEKLRGNRDQAIDLIIEMLRYQDWSITSIVLHASGRAT